MRNYSPFLLPLALANPVAAIVAEKPATEAWTVSRLSMRMMTANSGLPGGSWPASYRFNTSIDLDITIPHISYSDGIMTEINATAKCGGSWPNGTLPKGIGWECTLCGYTGEELNEDVRAEMGTVKFWLEAWDGKEESDSEEGEMGPGREELWYTLNVLRDAREGDGGYYTGGIHVSANNPSSPSGFLTCLNGPPLDGLRCEKGPKDGIDLSNHKNMQIVGNIIDSNEQGMPIMSAIDSIQIMAPPVIQAGGSIAPRSQPRRHLPIIRPRSEGIEDIDPIELIQYLTTNHKCVEEVEPLQIAVGPDKQMAPIDKVAMTKSDDKEVVQGMMDGEVAGRTLKCCGPFEKFPALGNTCLFLTPRVGSMTG